METAIYTLPVYWGPALVNGDRSHLTDEDEIILDKWLEDVKPGHCCEVSEETDFRQFKGLGTDVAEFTFLK